jgi:hypothetical protein
MSLGVYKVACLNIDLSDVPLDRFRRMRPDDAGYIYYTADFELKAKFLGDTVKW